MGIRVRDGGWGYWKRGPASLLNVLLKTPKSNIYKEERVTFIYYKSLFDVLLIVSNKRLKMDTDCQLVH